MTSTLLKPASSRPLNSPTLHQLDNGLTIVAEQIPVDAVNLSLWLNAGSANEPDAFNGMAHFLEHMVFKGTDRLQVGEFERLVEQRGAVANAATSQDYTCYYITAAPKDFAELAPLQLEVVFNAGIPDDAFEQERMVVLEEIRRSQDSPQRRTFRRSMELAFEQLPYRRPVLGPVSAVEQLTVQQMRDFHKSFYQPAAMTAVAVGNLPVDRLIQGVIDGLAGCERFPYGEAKPTHSIENPYSAWPDGQRSPSGLAWEQPAYEMEPAFETNVRREFVDPSLQQARLVMLWRVPGLLDLQQTYALDVIAAVLGYGRMGRLVRELREERGLVAAVAVRNMIQRLQGTFYVSVQLPAENLAAVEAAVVHHIRRLQSESVTGAEIERIRTQVANRFIFGNESPRDRASLYGYYHSLAGDLTPALTYSARLQSLNAEDLQVAVWKYLSPEAYGTVILRPTTETVNG